MQLFLVHFQCATITQIEELDKFKQDKRSDQNFP